MALKRFHIEKEHNRNTITRHYPDSKRALPYPTSIAGLAILSANVVDYTRLVEFDAADTLVRLSKKSDMRCRTGNAFVGGMVGLERTVVPLIGVEEFRIASTTIVVSFIVSFGVVKALATFADLHGRKHVLVLSVATGTTTFFRHPATLAWGLLNSESWC